jgi:hypothetical protein
MKTVTLKLTMEELNLLTTLVADQLFRKEFIDPKMPGYKTNADDIVLGKDLIRRLRHMLDPLSPKEASGSKSSNWVARSSNPHSALLVRVRGAG